MSEEDNRPGLNGEEFEVTFNEDFIQGPVEYPLRESEFFLSHNRESFRETWMNYMQNQPLEFVTPRYITGIDPYSNEPNVQLISQSQVDYGTQLVYGTGGDMSEGSKSFDDLFVSSSNQPKRTDVEGYVKTNNNKELERIKNG